MATHTFDSGYLTEFVEPRNPMNTESKGSGQFIQKRINVLLVDDHPCVLEGVRVWLSKRPHIKVVGFAQDADEAAVKVRRLSPDIVILDLSLPGFSGLHVMKRIQKENPSVKVIVYSMFEDIDFARAPAGSGVAGFVLKNSPLSVLVSAIETVNGGGNYFDPTLTLQCAKPVATALTFGGQPSTTLGAEEAEQIASSPEDRTLDSARLAMRATEYINGHLSPFLTLKEVASEFAKHPSDMDRIFWRVIGQTVKQYIDKSCRQGVETLLRGGDWKGSQLAFKLGFRDEPAFYRWVQRVFEMHFRQLREMYNSRRTKRSQATPTGPDGRLPKKIT